MNKREVLDTLNWFYSLELNQVDLYTAQSKYVDNIYIKKLLKRLAVIEQQHVDNIADKIKELGGKPTFLGDVIAPISGKIAGRITTWSGLKNMLKINIILEKRAMADYKDFIRKSSDFSYDLSRVLWSNLIDEDLHTAWFTNKLKQGAMLKKLKS